MNYVIFFQLFYSNNLGVSRRKRRVGLSVASPRTSFVRLRAFHCYPSREAVSGELLHNISHFNLALEEHNIYRKFQSPQFKSSSGATHFPQILYRPAGAFVNLQNTNLLYIFRPSGTSQATP